MRIKRKDMQLTDFIPDATKEYFAKEIKIGKNTGIASIMKFSDVKKPFEVHYNFKDEIIVDNGYTWIQIALEHNYFWIKAMYDDKDNLIEIYIDMTKGNYFEDKNNPEFDDLFLDVVVPTKGHLYRMDESDLMKALTEKVITKEEYNLSKTTCKKVLDFINLNHQEFLDFIDRTKKELEYELLNK